jgi:hypothetical protein
LATSGALPIEFWDPTCGTYNELGSDTASSESGRVSIANYSPGTFHKCYCQPFNCTDEIFLQVTSTYAIKLRAVDDGGNLLATVNFTNTVGNIRQVSFIPNDYDICDEQMQLQILRASDNAIIYRSDCLDIKSNHRESILIQYYNSPSRNFAGINYADVSPDPEFSLRLTGSFFHQRFPQEQEVEELSNSRSLQLSTELKRQKLLELGPMPYYMHQKVILALQHEFVTINGVEYVKQENYEINEGSRRSSLKQAKVWLTQKDYILRNIL